jgi:hypothetical protein
LNILASTLAAEEHSFHYKCVEHLLWLVWFWNTLK